MSQLTTPFLTMALTLYTVYFEYTVIGQLAFGGKISTVSAQTNDPAVPPLYYLLNFNDFCSGIITLFTLMVINNWFNTTNMLCDVTGTYWPRFYTFSFIMIVVWIMLSVLIAFVLEIHGVVGDEVEKEWKRREWVSNLRKGWSKGGFDVTTYKTLANNVVPLSDGEVLDERLKPVVTDVNNPVLENMLQEKEKIAIVRQKTVAQRRMSVDSAGSDNKSDISQSKATSDLARTNSYVGASQNKRAFTRTYS